MWKPDIFTDIGVLQWYPWQLLTALQQHQGYQNIVHFREKEIVWPNFQHSLLKFNGQLLMFKISAIWNISFKEVEITNWINDTSFVSASFVTQWWISNCYDKTLEIIFEDLFLQEIFLALSIEQEKELWVCFRFTYGELVPFQGKQLLHLHFNLLSQIR